MNCEIPVPMVEPLQIARKLVEGLLLLFNPNVISTSPLLICFGHDGP